MISTQQSAKQSLQMWQALALILLGKGTQTLAYLASGTATANSSFPPPTSQEKGKSLRNETRGVNGFVWSIALRGFHITTS